MYAITIHIMVSVPLSDCAVAACAVDEIRALANRLSNRAQSPLSTDTPEASRDMCLGAEVLRALAAGLAPESTVAVPAKGIAPGGGADGCAHSTGQR